MSRVGKAFESGKAFIPFITCGYPDLETTAEIVKVAAAAGASLIELGIPFSDPTAEGPVIQEANIKALEGGVTTDKIFQMVRELRKDVSVPLVFMTYANVVYSYGIEKFALRAHEAGMDGIILPDVPFEEKEEFAPTFRKYDMDMISLIAPTSKDRIEMIASQAEGFIYVVSSLGVTGVRNKITTDIGDMVDHIRATSKVPCAVGFGISTPDQVRDMTAKADGAIVGSAIIRIIGSAGKDAPARVGEYVRQMASAC